jgi:type IV pilus assembly protein PilW
MMMKTHSASGRHARGLSLVELLVAMALGLIVVLGIASVYLFTKSAFSRQSQISTLQQSVRTAFEYLGSDARMVGHRGCATGNESAFRSDLSTAALATNFGLGIEGYEYTNATAGEYTLTADAPTDITTAGSWASNTLAPGSIATLPIADLGNALSPGSDVLVIRTVIGKPLRLSENTDAAGTSMKIETVAGGKCSDGTTDKVSGFCNGSYGLVASCGGARAFQLSATLTMGAPLGSYQVFPSASSEVFPLQTIAYYIKQSSSGTTTSLYRRVFSGDPAGGVEQELLEDVESLQVLYGRDTTLPEADGTVDVYSTAQNVTDWNRVVTVRMGLLIRSASPLPADTKLAASAPLNGVTVTYPANSRYDRRVFTTTVALRNKITYFATP